MHFLQLHLAAADIRLDFISLVQKLEPACNHELNRHNKQLVSDGGFS